MGWEVEISDEDGKVIDTDFHGTFDRSYVLPDGRRCRMLEQGTAWCRDCRRFGTAEAFPSLAGADETIAAMRGGVDAYLALLARRGQPWPWEDDEGKARLARFLASSLPDWELYREWRALRRSPPRCLNCFSTEIDLVPDGSSEIVHPVTGRRLRVQTVAHLSMAHHYPYDAEGLPLPGDGTCADDV